MECKHTMEINREENEEAGRERRNGWSRSPRKPAEMAIFQKRGGLVLAMPGSAEAARG